MKRRTLITGAAALLAYEHMRPAWAYLRPPGFTEVRRELGFVGLFRNDVAGLSWTQAGIDARAPGGANRVGIVLFGGNGTAANSVASISLFGNALTLFPATVIGGNLHVAAYGVVATGTVGQLVVTTSLSNARWAAAVFFKDTFASTTPTTIMDDAGTGRDIAATLTAGSNLYMSWQSGVAPESRATWNNNPGNYMTEIARTHVGTNLNFSVAGLIARYARTPTFNVRGDVGAGSSETAIGLVFT